jgi:DNA-binding transcriptional ArsR family regulator
MSEAVGHLDILREAGKVKVREREGKDFYSLVI